MPLCFLVVADSQAPAGPAQSMPVAVAELPPETYLGVFSAPVPPAVAEQLADRIPANTGLIVLSIVPSSPAQRSGLQPHDLLLEMDGAALKSVDEFRDRIRSHRPGDRVTFDVVRRSQRIRIESSLAERPVPTETSGSAYRVVASAGPTRIMNIGPTASSGNAAEDVVLLEKNGRQQVASVRRPEVVRPLQGALTVTRRNSGEFEVAWEPTARVEGTMPLSAKAVRPQLEKEMSRWPAELQAAVAALCDRLSEPAPEGRQLKPMQLRIQPRGDGENRGVRLELQSHPDKETVRVFQLHHQFPPGAPQRMSAVMEHPALQKELQSQEPAIRRHIEETLRRTELPEVRINVQQSQ